MKQIKTIMERKSQNFDDKVNAALNDGWRMKSSKITGDLFGEIFIAQMEKEPGTCDDCRFRERLLIEFPCNDCGDNYEKWESYDEEKEVNHGQM